jgi:hypothetical protein
MFRFLTLSAVIFILLLLISQASYSQLVKNGNFENMSANMQPADWSSDCKANGSIQLTTANVFEGKNSLELSAINTVVCSFSQIIDLKNVPFKKYKISYAFRTQNLQGNSGITIIFKNGANTKLSESYNYVKDNFGEWKQFQVATMAPEGAETMLLSGVLSGSGKVWFDQIKIEELKQSHPSRSLFSTVSEFFSIANQHSIAEAIKWAVESK